MSNDNTLLDAAVTKLGAGINGKPDSAIAQVAEMVQAQDHENVTNRVALTYVKLQRDRDAARAINAEYSGVKPEVILLGFLQKMQNQVCWGMGAAKRAQDRSNQEEQANGIDFSSDIGEQIGDTGHTKVENFEQLIEDSFNSLTMVHAWLGQQMDYMTNVPNLRFYLQQTQNEDGEWVDDLVADSWVEAQECMATALERSTERKEAALAEQAADIDFGETGTDS